MSLFITLKNTFIECSISPGLAEEDPANALRYRRPRTRSRSLPSVPRVEDMWDINSPNIWPKEQVGRSAEFASNTIEEASTTDDERIPDGMHRALHSSHPSAGSECSEAAPRHLQGKSPMEVTGHERRNAPGARHGYRQDEEDAKAIQQLFGLGLHDPRHMMGHDAGMADAQEFAHISQVHSVLNEAFVLLRSTLSVRCVGQRHWILHASLRECNLKGAAQLVPHALAQKRDRIHVVKLLSQVVPQQEDLDSIWLRLFCFCFLDDTQHYSACWYWMKSSGTCCRYGDNCHWLHPELFQIDINLKSTK